MANLEYRTLYCYNCGLENTYQVIIVPGHSDWEFINCNICNEQLGEIRCDRGEPRLIHSKTINRPHVNSENTINITGQYRDGSLI